MLKVTVHCLVGNSRRFSNSSLDMKSALLTRGTKLAALFVFACLLALGDVIVSYRSFKAGTASGIDSSYVLSSPIWLEKPDGRLVKFIANEIVSCTSSIV